MKNKVPAPSELILDRFLIGDVTGDEKTMVHNWLEQSDDGEAIIEHRRRQAEAAIAPVPSFSALDKKVSLHNRSASTLFNLPSLRINPVGVFASLFLIGCVLFFGHQYGSRNDLYSKGSNEIKCVIKHDHSIINVVENGTIIAGDSIQFLFGAKDETWYMVYYSEEGGGFTSCTAVENAQYWRSSDIMKPLPFSIAIDSTSGSLRVVVLTSEKKFNHTSAITYLQNETSDTISGKWFRFEKNN